VAQPSGDPPPTFGLIVKAADPKTSSHETKRIIKEAVDPKALQLGVSKIKNLSMTRYLWKVNRIGPRHPRKGTKQTEHNKCRNPQKKVPTLSAGRSTADAITTVVMFVHRASKLGTICCLLALDITGAINNAWYPRILARLWELKCPPNIYSIIKDFLQDRNAHIKQGEATSSKRGTEESRRSRSRAQHYGT
jgi:hypothetical protein